MERLAAHRFHRLYALEVKPPPAVKGLSAHSVAAAKVFHAHTAGKLAQYFLSDFVCNLHGLKNEARARVCVSGLFFVKVDLCQ